MNLAFCLYLTDFIQNIGSVTSAIIILFVLAFIGLCFSDVVTSQGDTPKENEKVCKIIQFYKNKLWILAIAVFINAVIPTQKTMYMMLGASYLQTSNLPAKVSEAIDLKLDSVIADLKKTNNWDKNEA